MKIVQEELLKSWKKNKMLTEELNEENFKKAKKVLLILPMNTNKLLIQSKEPYEIMS